MEKQSKSISDLLNLRFIEPYLNISNSDFWLLVQQAVSAQIHILALGRVIGFQIAVNRRIAWNIEEYDWKTLIRHFPSIWAFTVQRRPWDLENSEWMCERLLGHNYWSNKIKKSSVRNECLHGFASRWVFHLKVRACHSAGNAEIMIHIPRFLSNYSYCANANLCIECII